MLINAAIPYTLYSIPMSPLLHIQFHFYDRMLCDLPVFTLPVVVVRRCCVYTLTTVRQAGKCKFHKNKREYVHKREQNWKRCGRRELDIFYRHKRTHLNYSLQIVYFYVSTRFNFATKCWYFEVLKLHMKWGKWTVKEKQKKKKIYCNKKF